MNFKPALKDTTNRHNKIDNFVLRGELAFFLLGVSSLGSSVFSRRLEHQPCTLEEVPNELMISPDEDPPVSSQGIGSLLLGVLGVLGELVELGAEGSPIPL